MSLAIPLYTGYERSYAWNGGNPLPAHLFEIRPPTLPWAARPIHDEVLGCVIGYQEIVSGFSRTFDLEGKYVSLSEPGLEAPLLDPFDAILVVGGIWKAGVRGLVGAGTRSAGAAISGVTLMGLRTRFHALSRQPLRFAEKPLQHMGNPDRFVPVHILRLAIRHGRRTPDPRGYRGLFMYTVPMIRHGRQRTLEVLVREGDYTVLHFLYK
ncbi:hypothetical protein [Cupriavidus sp. WS]|uniref:hypothetical protein n=1 Tax=Cupriavidus sp. WS TaxID=1312922 RepID=UPI0003AA502F|nr:hypothetical protein [Cupriavidus sp. WS]